LLLTYILVMGLVLVLVSAASFIFLNRFVDQLTFRRLDGIAQDAATLPVRLLQSLQPRRLQALLTGLGVREARALLLDAQGHILTDSRPQFDAPPEYVLLQPIDLQTGNRGQYGDGQGDFWLYVKVPIGDQRVLLLTARRFGVLTELGDDLLIPLLRAAAVGIALAVILAWLVSRWVSRPLQDTAAAARAVAGGDYEQRLNPTGPEEAHSLAVSFNEMVQRVKASQSAMKDFVANVSHELRTPITSIQGFAQAMLDGAASDQQSHEHAAQVIFDESGRLKRLVNDLLDLARMDAGQVEFRQERADVNAIVGSVLERLGLKAQEVEIRLKSDLPELPTIIGDGDRLAQVITNLIDNAIDHTPAGGMVKVYGSQEGGWITIHIEDTGPGIAQEELSRIFERFYQLDKSRFSKRGAGLGLAISREIIEAHQGMLDAKSIEGRGSRFSIRLPIARSSDITLATKI
jgi:signal transduction histidine kinase